MINFISSKQSISALAARMLCIFTATAAEPSHTLFKQLQACTKQVNKLERLGCYDHLLMKPAATVSSTAVSRSMAPANYAKSAIQVPQIIKPTRTEHLAKTPLNSDIQQNHDLGSKYLAQSQSAKIKVHLSLQQAKKNKQGKWIFYFANGQVWQQLEAKYISVPKNKPVVSTLSTGALGSFDLKIGQSSRVIKVKRVK